MDLYIHLTIEEREKIFFYQAKGYSKRKIASIIKRNPSTISRELNKNKRNEIYSSSKAQKQYEYIKKKCGRRKSELLPVK